MIKKAETRDSKTAAGGQGGPETKNEANTDGGGGDVKMPEMVKIEMVGTNRIGKEKYDDASSPLVVKSDGLTSHYTNEYDAFSPSAPLVSKSAIK